MKPALALLLIPAALTLTASARQTQVETGSAQVVIDALALDRTGVPVTDLKPEEIEVWIGHFRVPIVTLTAFTPVTEERAGRLLVLLLDDVTLPVSQLGRAKDLARGFVMKMTPEDRMAVVTLNGSQMESTGDRTKLLRAIDAYSVGATGMMRIDTLGAHVLTTIAALSRQLTEAHAGRKTIVGIGTGWVFDKPIPLPTVGADVRKEWIDAMRATAAAHAVLYAVDPRGLMGVQADAGDNGFARETGGHAFLNTNDTKGVVDRVLREASSYYMMAVSDPPVGRGADLRDLEVRSLRRGVTMRARRAIAGQ